MFEPWRHSAQARGSSLPGVKPAHPWLRPRAWQVAAAGFLAGTLGCGGGGGASAPAIDPPTISAQPQPQNVDLGQPVQFTVTAAGPGTLGYQWRKDGAALAGATGTSYAIASAQAVDSGLYTVVVSNAGGAVVGGPAALSVNLPPAITIQPASVAVGLSRPASFTVAAGGKAPLGYQWRKDGSPLAGASAPTFTLASAQAADAGVYTVVVSNDLGSATSAPATLDVVPPPVIQTFTATSGPLAIGASGVLSWSVTGAASLSIDSGVGVLATADGTRTVTPATTTTYTLTAASLGGSTTASATLTVDPTPFHITSFTAAQPQVPFGGTTDLSWTFAGLPLSLTLDGSTAGGSTLTVAPVRRQVFTLSGSNGAGSDTRTVSVAARGMDLLAGDLGGRGFIDGSGPGAGLADPANLAVAPSGDIYVADRSNSAIRKVTPQGEVTTFVGHDRTIGSQDGPAASASFFYPEGLAFDGAGNLYVADTGNNTIRKVTPAGVTTTLAGQAALAPGSDDGTGAAARFRQPRSLAADTAGVVFVADTANHIIRRITAAGVVTTVAGSAGNSGFADGTGTGARFATPSGIALDQDGSLLVADQENMVIRRVTQAGVVTTLAGTPGLAGCLDGPAGVALFNRPTAVSVDAAGTILVADSNNEKIRKIAPDGTVTTLAGLPDPGSDDGTPASARFFCPRGVAAGAGGTVYVADTFNCTLRRIGPGGEVTTLAGSPSRFGAVDGSGGAARFSSPRGMAVDPAGNVWLADWGNGTIRRITSAGVVTTFAGSPGARASQDGTGGAARFLAPSAVALGGDGNLYVVDSDDHLLRRITPAGVVTTLAGSPGQSGTQDGTGASARFNRPQAVAVGADGTIYVADTGNHTLRKVTPAGAVTTLAGSPGVSGYTDGTGTAAKFYQPTGLAVDAAGTLLVADSGNQVIRTVTPAGTVSLLTGQPGVMHYQDGLLAEAWFNWPGALALDAAGNLYVADQGNLTLRKVSPSGQVTTVAGTSSLWDTHPGPLPGHLAQPAGLAVTPQGDLVVAMAEGVAQITAP